MRFSDSFIFKGLMSSKMAALLTHRDMGNAKSRRERDWPCAALVSVLSGRKLVSVQKRPSDLQGSSIASSALASCSALPPASMQSCYRCICASMHGRWRSLLGILPSRHLPIHGRRKCNRIAGSNPCHGTFLERNQKMRFSNSIIFKGLLPSN